MPEISAALVMKLRKITGQGMMDCKKALAKADGDIDQAIEILRKNGLATLRKRAARETTEGKVICRTSEDGKTATLVTLCCETDFVANSDDFAVAADLLGDYALACSAQQGSEEVLQTVIDGRKFSDVLTELVSKIGEKIEVGDYAKFQLNSSGLIGSYIHFNGKLGAMVDIQASDEDVAGTEALKRAADDIAMHVTAIKPLALDRDGVDAATIQRERAIAAEQVKNKPPNILERIIDGKMNKFFAENCLLEQPFVKDDSKTVAKFLEQTARDCSGQAEIKRFVRFEVG